VRTHTGALTHLPYNSNECISKEIARHVGREPSQAKPSRGESDGQTDRRTDGRTDGQTDRRTDGKTDGRTDRERENESPSTRRSRAASSRKELAQLMFYPTSSSSLLRSTSSFPPLLHGLLCVRVREPENARDCPC
jgi:hypothetical protein